MTFIQDLERGTVADLVLMPQQAFQPEPTILIPYLYDPTTKPPAGGAAAGRGG